MLEIGGVPAGDLAAEYGTPLVAVDYDVLDGAIESFLQACAPFDIEIAYAAKALLLLALAKHLKHTPLHLDVCSLGELVTAERAGFPPERIVLHGSGKTGEEIGAAVTGRVGRIVVDNLDELDRLQLRAHESAPVNVVLRVNTEIEAHTHHFVRTAGSRTKFGLDPQGLAQALATLRESRALRFAGLHAHIGSQIFQQAAFAANAAALMECAAQCAQAGMPAGIAIVGGGFGVPMRPEDPPLDLAETIREIARTAKKEAERLRIALPQIGIEPGRAIVAQAGTSLYTVMAVKNQFGAPYVIVDGGIYENPRPALYDAYHHIVCASRGGEETVEMTVCGRSCENDELGTALLPRDLRAGDLLAMCTTGAYTYSMASNYNRFSRPAVVAVRRGTHRLIAQRESADDLLRNDCEA